MTMEIRNRGSEDLAGFLKNGRAAAAFVAAALDDEMWERARANPTRYFEARGVPLPRTLACRLLNGDTQDAERGQFVDTLAVRCWMVMVREDDCDAGERPKPVRMCIEVPRTVSTAA